MIPIKIKKYRFFSTCYITSFIKILAFAPNGFLMGRISAAYREIKSGVS